MSPCFAVVFNVYKYYTINCTSVNIKLPRVGVVIYIKCLSQDGVYYKYINYIIYMDIAVG